ncbi:MAG TPA: hypothetical protein VFY50_03810, partial [Candidatus Nitrosocosmicus sp.]|nr:hypothetical protein [Candidatus Nitrosocosmicus sp.]
LLLSNIHFNAGIQVLGQNNTSTTSNINNNFETAVSPTTSDTAAATSDTAATAPAPPSATTKLTGGVKINSPDKGDLVPLNSNKSLVIYGISKDNATSNCDVTIIVNNVKPYQNVQPTGIQGNNDYSTWKYTLASNYTSINEGNNKITSKVFCPSGIDGSSGIVGGGAPSASQAYYSVNVTGSNFTQAQLTNYEMMLESASNATNGGNSTLASSNNTIQPVAQIQQFNQDTGTGPVCCTAAGGTIPSQTTGTTIPTAAALADDTSEVTTTEEEIEEENIEEDNNSNEETEEDNNSNEDEDNENNDNDNDSGGDIMDDVEDTLRESGIDIDL